MTDDQIIKRRLMFDGEGTGDDRRITLLQKMIAKWILTEYGSPAENEMMYNKILFQLSLVEHSRRKSELIMSRNERQLQQYKYYQSEILNNVSNIKEAINTSKLILVKVKCEKHQKLNYDMIVKDIVEQPSRLETIQCVGQLKLNINNMKELKEKIENEFTLWHKHSVVLLTSVNQMCVMLNELKMLNFSEN